MRYQTSAEIEVAISRYFSITKYVIVPNVSWGMFYYELDLCVLNHRSLYAYEVEIKISKSDLRRDQNKWHHHAHNHNLIRDLYFAMPEKMRDCIDLVPERAGILLVDEKGNVSTLRKPKSNPMAKKWTYEQAYKLARLGTMRTWTMKRAIIMRKQQKANEGIMGKDGEE